MKSRKNNKTLRLTEGAVIAAAYAGATWGCAALGLAYGAIQFRLSEALTVLCLFTPAAVPGLAVGCLLGNLTSPYGVWDVLLGTLATLLAAFCARRLRHIKVKGIPLLSLLMPVVCNSLTVGAETALLAGGKASLTAFALAAAEVGAGEAVVCLTLGIPLFFALQKSRIFKEFP